ncbi:unnamed protein product [Gulo gulo]|uniref:Uncharacterized protein n=1 Tax=Gulo gulo TaxID=48420 RepID=A0A9X9LE87_GULGU|nr:unnamed protein product [Gulo gulo]
MVSPRLVAGAELTLLVRLPWGSPEGLLGNRGALEREWRAPALHPALPCPLLLGLTPEQPGTGRKATPEVSPGRLA